MKEVSMKEIPLGIRIRFKLLSDWISLGAFLFGFRQGSIEEGKVLVKELKKDEIQRNKDN